MDHFEVYGTIAIHGEIEFSDAQQHRLATGPSEFGWPVGSPVVAEIRRERKGVSSLQRGYWFGCLVPMLAEHIGDDEKSTHADLKKHLFPQLNLPRSITRRWKSKRTGRWRQESKPLSITDLNSKQMTDLIDLARKFAGEFHHCEIPEPDPSWRTRRAA